MGERVQHYWDLDVYTEAFRLQQAIFAISKKWPEEERFALTDQIRRSSRAIGANIAESWAKRRYPAHFQSKLTDADGELQETHHWLDSALACEYVTLAEASALLSQVESIGRMLGRMIDSHESFCFPTRRMASR